MKKMLLFILILTFISVPAIAWLDCSPTACGANEIGQWCSCNGGTCYRNCTAAVCTNAWVLVHDTECGWDDNDDEESCISNGYTSNNPSLCYNFTYTGPAPTDANIRVSVDQTQSCDTEAIGGFWDNTNRANPWFSSMPDYLGSTPGHGDYNYLLKAMRAHAEDDVIGSGSVATAYRNLVSKFRGITCAPSQYACSLMKDPADCATTCYGRNTVGYSMQGYFEIFGSQDQTLYNDDECGGSTISQNRMLHANNLRVYSAPTVQADHFITCDRINEPPVASNVKVLPLLPTLGDDLTCNYTYYDPEGYDEQNTRFTWLKNGINQNINSSTLNKENLSLGDSWGCSVTPGDGLILGNNVQSNNFVGIATAVNNLKLFIGNVVWNYQGFFGGKERLDSFGQAINNELKTCIPDTQGFCTINLDLESSSPGNVSLTDLELYYYTSKNPPQVFLNHPDNLESTPALNIIFNCSSIAQEPLSSLTLYSNWSGIWEANETFNFNNVPSYVEQSVKFKKKVPFGHHSWSCLASDNSGLNSWSENRTLIINQQGITLPPLN